MPIDPSIILGVKPPEISMQQADPLEQANKALSIKALLGQSNLQGLQYQEAERSADANQRIRALFATNPKATSADVMGLDVKTGLAMKKAEQEQALHQSTISKNNAETGNINAGRVAGVWSTLAAGDGSDQAVMEAAKKIAQMDGPENAKAMSEHLLQIPQADRLKVFASQMMQHKVGQDAAKILFPAAHMQNLGGTVAPVSTSTMPGATPGSVIPGGTVTPLTLTPGEVQTGSHQKVMEGQGAQRLGIERQNLDVNRVRADPMGVLGINKNPSQAAVSSSGLSGDEYLKTLPPGVAAQVKAISEGKLQISPMTSRSPQGAALIQMAMQYEPGTDQTVYMSRASTAKDAASGKLSVSNNALNTLAGHLAGLSDSADKLNNTSFPWVNQLKNFAATKSGNSAQNTFKLNVQAVAEEFERAYRGAGGDMESIRSWKQTLDDSSSPQQFKDAMAKGAELLQSKLEANQAQYTQGMHGKVGDYNSITPKAAAAFSKLRGTAPVESAQPAAPAINIPAVPKLGERRDGYIYKGGDPANPKSWER